MNRVIWMTMHPFAALGKVFNRLLWLLPDRLFLKIKYRQLMGRKLDLKNPQTFNEKLQWLKLYDHNPIYTTMVDKFEAKRYVAGIIGEEYIIPTIGVWERVDSINWDNLPNQFVLKCTHDSGGLVICRDKTDLNKKEAMQKLRNGLRHDYYLGNREWPYKNVPRRIIAERYMEDEITHELRDYKFFCFDGKVKMFKVDYDRFTEHHANYYTPTGELLPFGEVAYPPKKDKVLELPTQLKQMVEMAERLSKGIPFLRVDFYVINGCIYFGELTFFPASGMGRWTDDRWDKRIGAWIKLPPNNR